MFKGALAFAAANIIQSQAIQLELNEDEDLDQQMFFQDLKNDFAQIDAIEKLELENIIDDIGVFAQIDDMYGTDDQAYA